ncbi:MAG: P-loop NTPase [Thermoprotei archaeon]|jgi:MinD-like ATPase involved in chromosome partitioning or flagellar assembly
MLSEAMAKYRLSVVGVKGGVGKSTVSLIMALRLASSSKRVLLIDRDIIGWVSYLAGVRSKGLLAKVVDGEEDYWNSVATLNFGEGKLTILKLYGDGDRLYEDTEKIHSEPGLRTKFKEVYGSILSSDSFDYFIVDNLSGVSANSPLITHELEAFYSWIQHVKNLRIYVTNYLPTRLSRRSSTLWKWKAASSTRASPSLRGEPGAQQPRRPGER